MSRENVEVVRSAIDAMNRRDMGFHHATPDVEYDLSRTVGSVHGVFHGVDEIRRAVKEFTELWESSRFEVSEFIEVGDHVVTPFTNYLRGRDGVEVKARAAFLWTIRDGSVARCAYFQERTEALEAAGLRE